MPLIRPFRPADADALLAIRNRSILAVDDALYSVEQRTSWVADRRPDAFARAVEDGVTLLVAEQDGRPAGYCGHRAEGTDGRITALHVDPEAQGAGLGRALLQHAERALFAQGVPRILVQASLPAQPFYAAQGYRVARRHTAPTGGGLEIAVAAMEKPRPVDAALAVV